MKRVKRRSRGGETQKGEVTDEEEVETTIQERRVLESRNLTRLESRVREGKETHEK